MQEKSSSCKRRYDHEREPGVERKFKHARQDNQYKKLDRKDDKSIVTSNPKTDASSAKTLKSEKLNKLLQSLDELLENEEETRQILGGRVLEQCSTLRQNLRQLDHQPKSPLPIVSNVPKSLSHLTLTPWTSSAIPATLPPLPEVFDPTLKAGAFIHQGVTSGRLTDLSYERLEWVGDAYLYITSTLLISQTFPALLPGKCSQMRERIVKNVQLAEYAKQYGFEQRAVLPDNPALKFGGERTKMLGDMFEAYIAAVILSDPVNGVARCSEWLKAVWSMTLERDIRAQERGTKLDSPLWRLRGNEEPIQFTTPKEAQELPAKDRLRKLICSPGIELTYKDCAPERRDPTTKLTIFSVGIFLTGWGEKDKKLGFGSALGKKDAGQKAAEMALANTKLMNGYAEKKRLFDAQRELEKQALEGLA